MNPIQSFIEKQTEFFAKKLATYQSNTSVKREELLHLFTSSLQVMVKVCAEMEEKIIKPQHFFHHECERSGLDCFDEGCTNEHFNDGVSTYSQLLKDSLKK